MKYKIGNWQWTVWRGAGFRYVLRAHIEKCKFADGQLANAMDFNKFVQSHWTLTRQKTAKLVPKFLN